MKHSADWLLPVTKGLIHLARLVFAFVALGLVIAIGFTIFAAAERFASLDAAFVEAGLSYTGRIGMGIVFALSLGTVFLIDQFLKTLKQIIDTVSPGDPFIPENAQRLSTMATLAASMQALGLIAVSFSDDVKILAHKLGIVMEPSVEGVLFALILFILARVFRQGAEMRQDLEGTV